MFMSYMLCISSDHISESWDGIILHDISEDSDTDRCHSNGSSRVTHVELLAEVRNEQSEGLQNNTLLQYAHALYRVGLKAWSR